MKDLLAIQIETTNICNSKCLFCPHDKFEHYGHMPDFLYKGVLEQASHLPNLGLFIPMLTGEPLCDPNFVDRLLLARKMLPNAEIDVYTNGSLIKNIFIQAVKNIPGLRFSISLNGMNPETRKRVMGLDDYWQVIQSMKEMERAGVKYRATMVGYPDISREECASFIEAGGMVIQYQSWAGIEYPHQRRRWTQCARALNYLTIKYDGQVCLCCFDPFGEVSFGNLNHQTIEEIWTSDEHKHYQIMHKMGKGQELPKCRECTEG